MKPLKLTMQAFGSYLNKTTIDFTQFDGKGPFLICGKTGAGKTTIFAALVFALYGDVIENDPSKQKQVYDLRTINAPDETPTQVTLDFECQGRTYRIVRTIELKKSKDGSITTRPFTTDFTYLNADGKTEQIPGCNKKTAVQTFIVDRLLHLTKEEFEKVILIPQGAFESVLVDSTKDRTEIFRKMFGTEIYNLFIGELGKRFQDAKAKIEQLGDEIDSAFNSFNVNLDPQYTYLPDFQSLTAPKSDCQKRLELLVKTLEWYSKMHSDSTDLYNTCDSDYQKVNALLQSRQQLDDLDRTVKNDQIQLADAQNRLKSAQDSLDRLNASQGTIAKKTIELHDIQNDLPKYNIIDSLQKVIQLRTGQLDQTNKNIARLSDQRNTDTQRLNDLDVAIAKHIDVVAERQKLVPDQIELQRLRDLLTKNTADIGKIDEIEENLGDAQRKRDEAQVDFNRANGDFNRIEGQYLSDIATLLASKLTADQPCPVCGSKDHPHPAVEKLNGVNRNVYDAAKAALDRAQKALNAAEVDLQTTINQKKRAIDEAVERLKEFGAVDYDTLRKKARKNLQTKIGELDFNNSQEQKKIDRIDKAQKAEVKEHDALQKSINAVINDLNQFTVESGKLETQILNDKNALNQNISGLKYPTRAEANRVISTLTKEIDEHARLVANATDLVRKYAGSCNTLQGKIDTETKSIDNLKAQNIPSLSDLNTEIGKAKAKRDEANRVCTLSQQMIDETKRVKGSIEKLATGYDALVKNFDMLNDLFSTINGRVNDGGDRTDIEIYVQKRYLDIVLGYANKLLHPMTDGMYSLVRAEEAYNNKSKSGLEINVIDTKVGKARKSSTLSGGEKFMASLSLAFGLADMLSNAKGASRIECTFIDEGFGSLDQERLDALMRVLSSNEMQNGRALVGLISHVDTIDDLISNKIEVTKDEKGFSKVDCIV